MSSLCLTSAFLLFTDSFCLHCKHRNIINLVTQSLSLWRNPPSSLLSSNRHLFFSLSCTSSGCTAELVPGYLWRAAADVHGAGGGRVCARHFGQHAVHGAHRAVHGCGEAAVHSSNCGQQALLFPRWRFDWVRRIESSIFRQCSSHTAEVKVR